MHFCIAQWRLSVLRLSYYNRCNSSVVVEQYQRAIDDYDHAIRLDPDIAKAYMNRGIVYSMLNELAQSVKDFDKVIELDPSNAGAYRVKGIVLEQSGQTELAIKAYQKACELDRQYCSPPPISINRNIP